jgi:hypothetical protein
VLFTSPAQYLYCQPPSWICTQTNSTVAIDSPEMMPAMENFSVMFHEPYYRNYITDDLVERLEKAGFQDIATQNHFMSKYWIAHKPHLSA